ncbi:phospho-N-acetylmuramoyl-pentapeptide-transferase [Patescibacteria group bacterium]|nr:phospho-N-acetylmuramoyl-pentapeptide-transferase [Patescibacteria group bacterium]MBU1921835.1 phospho-N-acetylmuramoyl-pentapeptide-transferase [Patescibacteria group bacterium]
MLDSIQVLRILALTAISFVAAMAWTPLLTHFLYKHKLGKSIRDDGDTPVFSRLHKAKAGTPTMGGVLIWGTVLVLAVLFANLAIIFKQSFISSLDFLSRAQTLLPLGVLVVSALIGLLDDYYNVRRIGPHGGGLRMRHRIIIYTLIAAVGAWWFYYKLGWDIIHVPFVGDVTLGWLIIPFFILVIVATSFSVNETDGLDGLAGGALMISFGAYAAIAFLQGKYDLAAFCAVILGALLAFLWFNINPARFFMGDTGAMSLGVTLGIVAMLTKSVLLLPIIGFIFVIESASVILQIFSKKVFKRKLFRSTPIHHHFEAMGWPEQKVVMRFWVVSIVMAFIGLAIYLMDRT